ncbi:purine permease 3-like [Amborella trichopoda]|uniref:purine permease 3-like n=1 Tax=Amborella trichopoda TaxID=13333 RepID=UPI0009BF61A4|nr:purine permease 3-like [Amborella trichopoda]|eukprot:XP_020520975.1 purine permease 3-like [Amborella trichopoda]
MGTTNTISNNPNPIKGYILLAINGLFLILGGATVPPLLRLYFIHGGQRNKAKVVVTYTLVLEMQVIMYVVATAFCTVGMIVNKNFQAIQIEAKEFGLGECKYYLTVVASGVMCQLFFIGNAGFIFCTSSMVTCVFVAVLIPVNELLVVLLFHEKFTGEKGMVLVLSMWGFVSYFHGKHLNARKKTEPVMDVETNQL